MKRISKYLTTDKSKFGCFLYMYSARWNLKYRLIHRYYTGLTTNIRRRWAQHKSGIMSGWKGRMNYKYHRKPSMSLDFIGIVPIGTPFRIAEKYVQSLPKSKKLKLIESIFNLKYS